MLHQFNFKYRSCVNWTPHMAAKLMQCGWDVLCVGVLSGLRCKMA